MAKMAIQFTMTAIAGNLKRLVKLLFHRGCLGTSKPENGLNGHERDKKRAKWDELKLKTPYRVFV